MKLSEISPQPSKGSNRRHYKGAERGGFTFDMGQIAFGNPLDLIGKSAKARAKARETWNETGKKTRVKKSERSDYHRKHG